MNYESFRLAWRDGLRASGLRGTHSEEETIDLRCLDRRWQGYVHPHAGQDAEPWFVTARVAWRWSALQSARTATTEEDLLTELFGDSDEATTEPAWLRVDVELLATLPLRSAFPVPEAALLRAWSREVIGRLQTTEPLLPTSEEAAAFVGLVGPGWLGTPAGGVQCEPDGRLAIER
jgi:hypothetical protein